MNLKTIKSTDAYDMLTFMFGPRSKLNILGKIVLAPMILVVFVVFLGLELLFEK